MNRVSILGNILKSQISAAVLTLTSLLTLVVLTRNTEVAVFGQYAVILGTVTMFAKFAGFNAFFFYRNKYPLLSYSEALRILAGYLPFVMASGMIVALSVGAINALGTNFVPLQTTVDYGLWILLLVLSLLNFEIFRFYQSIGRYLFGLWMVVFSKVVCLALLLLEIFLSPLAIGLHAVIIALISAQFANLLLQLFLDREFHGVLGVNAAGFEWKSIPAGLMLIPSALFNEGVFFFDRITVSYFLGFETAGYYSLASQGIVILYSIMGGTIITLFYPKLVVMKSSGEQLKFKKTVFFLFIAGIASCTVGAVCIMFASKYIPILFGDKYNRSISVINYMAFLPIFLFTLSFMSHLSYIYDRTRASAAIFFCGIPISVALNVFLVKGLGFTGAIVASYVSLALVMLAQCALLVRAAVIGQGKFE